MPYLLLSCNRDFMGIQVGEVIGDYRVEGILGKGGMGKVFRVRSLITGREEAMKMVLPDLDASPELADRFLREIRVHASLDHPNIAALYTALRVENRLVMIMELVDGLSLADKLQNGPLDPDTAVDAASQVLDALEYAHARGVIHRDIKPANILITRQGRIKLTDFGIARAASDDRITRTGFALGSLPYMSPEQIRSEPVDARSDIYSMGIALYELVTGRRPIQGDSEYALMNAQLQQAPTPPIEIRPSLPRAVSAAITKALAKNPAERWQTAGAFRSALRQAGSATATAGAPASAGWDADLLARLTQALAPHLGPIAKVVVTRAARQASTEDDLFRSLAAEIPVEADRKRFLATRGR